MTSRRPARRRFTGDACAAARYHFSTKAGCNEEEEGGRDGGGALFSSDTNGAAAARAPRFAGDGGARLACCRVAAGGNSGFRRVDLLRTVNCPHIR